jgi:hypothetical protein
MPRFEHPEDVLPFGHLDEFDLPFPLPHGGNLQGVIVLQVTEGSPAAIAGIVEGDLITAVDGEPVEDPEALASAIGQHRPGDRVTLTIHSLRDQEEREATVTLVEHPDQEGKGYLGVTISGALHMEGLGEGRQPGQFRFHFRDDGSSDPNQHRLPFDFDGLPFDPGRLPIDPGRFRLDPDQWPFDPDEGLREFEYHRTPPGDA